MKLKDWKKIAGYLIPIIALVVANAMGLNPTELEDAIAGLVTAALGLLATIGVISNNDKKDKKDNTA